MASATRSVSSLASLVLSCVPRRTSQRAVADSLRRVSDDFARVTAVEKTADGQYEGSVEAGWDIAGVPNGGYLLAIAGRAMAESIGRPPLAVTAHYLAPAHAGPCSVLVESVRVGRRTATLTAKFEQDGRESFRVLGTFGGCLLRPAARSVGVTGTTRI